MADPSSRYNVDVRDAQGAVIGEHLTIYQYFGNPRHMSLAVRGSSTQLVTGAMY